MSSYEQDASVLVEVKKKLVFTTPDLRKLYSRLQDLLLFEMEKELKSMVSGIWQLSAPQNTKFGFLSLLLRQMQVAEFLGIAGLFDI